MNALLDGVYTVKMNWNNTLFRRELVELHKSETEMNCAGLDRGSGGDFH